uniref:Uncharacterized protein n=2 Tax=Candidatus Kentrum sp. FW TaxID=2126338 RepID=A0A450S989_9GAMM|nr:MAG: hypothetical protein BECKFW1821A_GA0114235_102022 [Candidatus Kentron sp. FW]
MNRVAAIASQAFPMAMGLNQERGLDVEMVRERSPWQLEDGIASVYDKTLPRDVGIQFAGQE